MPPSADEPQRIPLRKPITEIDLQKFQDEDDLFSYQNSLGELRSAVPLEDRQLLHQSAPLICFVSNAGGSEGSLITLVKIDGGRAVWTRSAECPEELKQIECLYHARGSHVSALTVQGNVLIYRLDMNGDEPRDLRPVRTYNFPNDALKPIKAGWHSSPDWLFMTFHKDFLALHDLSTSEPVTIYDTELSISSKCRMEKYQTVRRVAGLQNTIPTASAGEYKSLLQFRDFCVERIAGCDRLLILFTEGHLAVYNCEEDKPLVFKGVFRLETSTARQFLISGTARPFTPPTNQLVSQYALMPVTADMSRRNDGQDSEEWKGINKSFPLFTNALCLELENYGEYALYDIISWTPTVPTARNSFPPDNCRISPLLGYLKLRNKTSSAKYRYSPVFLLNSLLSVIVQRQSKSRGIISRCLQLLWTHSDLRISSLKLVPGTRALISLGPPQTFALIPTTGTDPETAEKLCVVDLSAVKITPRGRRGSAAISASSSNAPSREVIGANVLEDDNEGDVESSDSSSENTEEEAPPPDIPSDNEEELGTDEDGNDGTKTPLGTEECEEGDIHVSPPSLRVPPGFSSPLEADQAASERVWGVPQYTPEQPSPPHNISLDALASLIASKLDTQLAARPTSPEAILNPEEIYARLDKLVMSHNESSHRTSNQVERAIQQAINVSIKSLSDSLSETMSTFVCPIILKGVEEALEERMGVLADTVKSSVTAASEEAVKSAGAVGEVPVAPGVSEDILNLTVMKIKNDILAGVAKQMSTLQSDSLGKLHTMMKSALASKLGTLQDDVAEIRQNVDLQKDVLVQQFSSQLERLFEQQRSLISEQFSQNRSPPPVCKDNTELIEMISENSSSMKTSLDNLRMQVESMRQDFMDQLASPGPLQRRPATVHGAFEGPYHSHHTAPAAPECIDCASEAHGLWRYYHHHPPPSTSSRSFHPDYVHHHHDLPTTLEMPTCTHRATRSQYGGPTYTDRSIDSTAVPPIRPPYRSQYEPVGSTVSANHWPAPSSASAVFGRHHQHLDSGAAWAAYGPGRLAAPSSVAVRTNVGTATHALASATPEDQLTSSRSAQNANFYPSQHELSNIDLDNVKDPTADNLLKYINDGQLDVALYVAVSRDHDDDTHGFWTQLTTKHVNVKDDRLKDKTSTVVAVVKVLADSMAVCFQNRTDDGKTVRIAIPSPDSAPKRIPMAAIVCDAQDATRRASWMTQALMNVNYDEVALSIPEKAQLTVMIERAMKTVERYLSDGNCANVEMLRSRDKLRTELRLILALCERLGGTRT